jgi:hypothetical protein
MKTIINLFSICFFNILIISCNGTSDKKAQDSPKITEVNAQIKKIPCQVKETGSEQEQESTTQIEAENTWVLLELNNYSISIPTNKHLIKDLQAGTFTLYLNERDNITMEINDLSGYNLSLSEFSRQYIEHLGSEYNTTVLQNKRTTNDNLPCQKIICAFDDGHGEIKIKSMYNIWVKNNWAYTLSFTSRSENFENLKPMAQKILDSFNLTH